MSNVCPVIARVAPRRNWPDKGTPSVDLFLPYDPVNPGRIAVWDGSHGEASLDYYHETKPPRTTVEIEASFRATRAYRRFLASIPGGEGVEIDERERLPVDWRDRAWLRA